MRYPSVFWAAIFAVGAGLTFPFKTGAAESLETVAAPNQSGGVATGTISDISDPLVSVYVVLDDEPAVKTSLLSVPQRKSLTLAAVKNRAAQIEQKQVALQRVLDDAGFKVMSRYTRLANAIKVRVPASKVAQLKELPGVKRIENVRLYYPSITTSVPFIGAPGVWNTAGTSIDGSGMRIGFIDSGIDYTHADFGGTGDPADYSSNDPTRIEPGTFPTAKVVGGFDFAGNTYNAASGDPVVSTPLPDPDPLDCNGHGSHVAGIAAGFGVRTNGLMYTGTYATNLNLGEFAVGPGVAPKALLYALKIFGCDGPTDLVLEALEWAADPNGDMDFSDRLDVVNMSLGSSFGIVSPDDVVLNAANRLSDLGCAVVVAAGNSGNIFYTIGAPGVAESAISVGNSIDGGLTSSAIQVLAPAPVAGIYEAIEGQFTKPLSETGPIAGKVVYALPNKGCEDLTNAPALKGNIAMMDRGICFFVDKIQRAQDAGAIAVIMVNNDDGPPPIIIMGGTNANITIPGVMISKADGDLLKPRLANLRVRLDADLVLPGSDRADQLEESSSRGPSSPGSLLKPEITAPGLAILSAEKGSGSKATIFSGTSMSAPHVAGAAALLKQLHPAWPVEEIKAALMNTAAPTKNPEGKSYPESRAGAGRVRVDQAVKLQVTAAAENTKGLVSLSLGDLVLTNKLTQVRHVRISNHSMAPISYQIEVVPTVAENSFELTPLTNRVTVPPESSLSFPFRLNADPAKFDRTGDDTTPNRLNGQPRQTVYEASGQIQFRNSDHSLHLPYYAILRAGANFSASRSRFELSTRTNILTVSIPIQGMSAHPTAFVSAFQLGASSRNDKITDRIFAAADLLAVGAASDAATQRSVNNSTIYFGIATAESWTTPQSFLISLEVLIDVDRDGVVDYVLINANDGALTAQNLSNPDTANDVFVTVVRDIATGLLSSGGFLNIFTASQRDTAPFNNSVLILTVPAQLLGLSDADARFNYRVVSRGPGSSRLIDQTGWIPFNAAKPAVDTALFGSEGFPIFNSGTPVKVQVDRSAAIGAGFGPNNPVSVLLLHHFNPAGHRFEIVQIGLGDNDADNDGISDDWEMDQFEDLVTANDRTDADQDGFTDFSEFQAGTNPKDRNSRLQITSVTPAAKIGLLIQWPSVADRFYSLQRSASLTTVFTNIAETLPATPPLNSFTDTNAAGSGPIYYRLKLE